jgi:hypothetical protein
MTTFNEYLNEHARHYLRNVIKGRTITEAAKVAGRNRTDFHNVLRRYGIKPNRRKAGNWKGLA